MDALEKYVHDFSEPEEKLLHELDRETNLRAVAPRMISGHIQGRLLEMLVMDAVVSAGARNRPSRVTRRLDGRGAGGRGRTAHRRGGRRAQEFIRSYFDRSPHGGKIRLHIGSALDIAPKLGGEFDLVFIDGDKREYPAYYRMLMGDDGSKALHHSGSVLIADNILWSRKVVQPVAHNDRHTQVLLEFNRMVVEDARVENVIVPLRDGLNLIRVK